VCSCVTKRRAPRRSVRPLCKAVHQRVTPELEYQHLIMKVELRGCPL
jgi:hypothetical protein